MERIFEDLRDIVMREIDDINRKGELDENSLMCAYKLIDIVKDIHEIDAHENGYSQTGMYYDGYRGNSYTGGYSNRNRDGMGRYSRNSERDDLMAKMEHMINTAGSETERQTIKRIMNQL